MTGAEGFHGSLEDFRCDGRVTNEPRLNGAEQLPQTRGRDELTLDHGFHIADVTSVSALDLRQCLAVEIIVIEIQAAMLRDEDAAILPARKWGRN